MRMGTHVIKKSTSWISMTSLAAISELDLSTTMCCEVFLVGPKETKKQNCWT